MTLYLYYGDHYTWKNEALISLVIFKTDMCNGKHYSKSLIGK